VLSLSIYNQLVDRGFSRHPQFANMWQWFLEVANASQYIASNHDPKLVEKAYIAGLLHDFGRICLHRYFPEEAGIAQMLVSEGMNVLDAERAAYGTDHQEIGQLVAVKWGMPRGLAEVICNHHPISEDFVPGLPELTRMIILADNTLFVKQLNLDSLRRDSLRLRLVRKSSQSLGVDVGQLNRIYSVLPKHFLYTVNSEADRSEKLDRLSRMNNQLFDLYLELAHMFKERQELSRRLLEEGKMRGTLDSLHIALATLSHYVNNAMMSIRGQSEVMHLLFSRGDSEQAFSRIPAMTESVENAIERISIVLEELSNIISMETVSYFRNSKAIDVDKSLKERLDSRIAAPR